MQQTHRNSAVDAVRTVALIGICVVNLPFLGLPVEDGFIPPEGRADQIAAFAVEALFQAKFFLLFSFLFGWGMHIQDLSAARAGVSFAGRYFRRIAVLAVMGCLHAILVFTGDILLLYALIGVLIWPLRGLNARQLIRVALWMVPVTLVLLTILALILPTEFAPIAGPGLGGSYLEATQARWVDWPASFGFLLLLQGPLVFGAFAVGLAAAKSEFFTPQSPGRLWLHRATPSLLALGLPLNLFYAAVMSGFIRDQDGVVALTGFLAIGLGAPMLAAAYLQLILTLSQRAALPSILVLAGRNSLSSYVLQGVIAGALFGAYGLGLFDRFGQAALVPISIGVGLAAMLIVGVLARRFGRGPLEALLRRVTYGRHSRGTPAL